MPMDVPAYVIEHARAADAELWPVLVAIARYETWPRWDPASQGDYKLELGGPLVPAVTDGAFPTSFGYLQFHTDGGLGTGINPSVLLDGRTNMRLGAQHLRFELGRGKTLYEAMWPWSTRDLAWAYYQDLMARRVNDPIPPAPLLRVEPVIAFASILMLLILVI